MPPAVGGEKQIAVVQPQRRDTNEHNNVEQRVVPKQQSKRSRTPKNESMEHNDLFNETDGEKMRRKTANKISPDTLTTKATLWIESRKTSPRKSVKVQTPPAATSNVRKTIGAIKRSTPLRTAVLSRAAASALGRSAPALGRSAPARGRSAPGAGPGKVQAPLKIDHTKQVALMLMTGHTPKSKQISSKSGSVKKTPLYLVKKSSPVRKTPRSQDRAGNRRSNTPKDNTQKSRESVTQSDNSRRSSKRTSESRSVPLLEITDKDARRSTVTVEDESALITKRSPILLSPKKSAMKDPFGKRPNRKLESIKFDLSNLENHTQNESDISITEATKENTYEDSASEDDITLHFSDSPVQSSPKKYSRSSKILENTLGTIITFSPSLEQATLTSGSPGPRKSLRGSAMLQALETTGHEESTMRYSHRITKPLTDQSGNTTVLTDNTHTLSPTARRNLETYSIVDLVSVESGASASLYKSVGSSNSSSVAFGTPQNNIGRKTRSTIDPVLLGSSTPYVRKSVRPSLSNSRTSSRKSSPLEISSGMSTRSKGLRKSKSIVTPENTQRHISINSTKITRPSKSRSRINDSDLLLISSQLSAEDSSPRTSKRITSKSNFTQNNTQIDDDVTVSTYGNNFPQDNGTITPENENSPEEAGTPVLSIQSLLDSTRTSLNSPKLNKRSRLSTKVKRHTIGGRSTVRTDTNRIASKSRSLNFSARKTRLRLSKDSNETDPDAAPSDGENVTPKSTVKLVQEDVKNKHSTAKKPQSKRSIIDNLDESDIVKQLFSSPVKRKLSQSMTEFSRKHLSDEEVPVKRPTRNTIALGRTPENSVLLDRTEQYTPEVFVSPLGTPDNSPNLSGIRRLYQRKTPKNDLSDVTGVKRLLRTPRPRKSVKNDLTNVSELKLLFAKSPRNRLSDVRGVKEVFAAPVENDLRRVSGVKSLFQLQKGKSPKNDLTDVRGVRKLFQKNSPRNDLRDVTGVKRILRRNSPRNDLSDVRGVRRLLGEDYSSLSEYTSPQQNKQHNDLNDVSGVEQLLNDSHREISDTESLFDELIGKPRIKATYSKSFRNRSVQKSKSRRAKSLHIPIDVITNNVEEWLEQELQKRLRSVDHDSVIRDKSGNKLKNISRNLTQEAHKSTATSAPIASLRSSRSRNRTLSKFESGEKKRAESSLPIKKRSLVETSLEKSKKKIEAINLPIKKRALVHSTPVKGTFNSTVNSSELGRVSPIMAETTSHVDIEKSKGFKQRKTKAPAKHKTIVRDIESNQDVHIENEPVKVSPRKTRARINVQAIETKSKRTRKTRTQEVLNTKKRRSSLVITKKSPVLSPAPAPTRKTRRQVKAIPKSAEKTPVKRNNRKTASKVTISDKSQLTRSTRTRVVKAAVVVSKPSPQLKPQPVRRTRRNNTHSEISQTQNHNNVDTNEIPKRRNQRKGTVKKLEIDSHNVGAKGKKMAVERDQPDIKSLNECKTRSQKSQPKSPEPQRKRGRKTVAEKMIEQEPPPKRSRRTAQEAEIPESKTRISRKTAKVMQSASVEKPKSAKKTRRIVAQNSLQYTEVVIEKVNTTHTRKKQQESQTSNKTRSTKAESQIVEPLPKRRQRTGVDNTVIPERGNKRTVTASAPKLTKSKSEEVVETKRSTRGTKIQQEVDLKPKKRQQTKQPETSENREKKRKVAQTVDIETGKVGRRGRKDAQVEIAVAGTSSRTGGRKQKLDVETISGKLATRARRAPAAASASPAGATRRPAGELIKGPTARRRR